MIQDILKDLILEHIGPLKQASKGWRTRNCMLCHLQGESADGRGRFGILLSPDGTIVIRCFNCKYSAKFVPGEQLSRKFQKFMLEIGIPEYDIKKLNFELYKTKQHMELDPEIKLRKSITSKWVPGSLPDNSYSIAEWISNGCTDQNLLSAAEYAYNRNMRNFNELFWTPDRISAKAVLNKRIIIPFYYKDNIVGYTGRYTGTSTSKDTIKYLNHMPPDYLYNLDAQSDFNRKYVILVEGVIDAYLIDGISPSGNELNDEQAAIINSLGKQVILCPDNDAAGSTMVSKALQNGWAVSFPNWEHGMKDVADAVNKYGRILTLESIIQSAEYNPLSIQVKWKMARSKTK